MSPVPSGCENTTQCTSAKPQETLQPHTFLQEPYFLFMLVLIVAVVELSMEREKKKI